MVRDINLISYLPQFVQDYRQMQEIMKAENPEFQVVADESEVIKNNQFILTCNEVGIKRFESLLGITATEDDTLASRISRVLVRWNDSVPYTWRVFLQKIYSLCGDDCEINPNFNQYELEIITHLDLYGQIDELENLIDYMIPCNIAVSARNELNYQIAGVAKLASGVAFCNFFILTPDGNDTFRIQNTLHITGASSDTLIFTLSDNFNEEYQFNNSLNFAGTNNGCVRCTITDNFNETFQVASNGKFGSTVDIVSIITRN